MAESYDLVVIGAGSAGLTAVGFAVQLGTRVAVVRFITSLSQGGSSK